MTASNNLEQLSDLIKRQSQAFAELNVNMTFEQMADVVARHMLPQPGRFLALCGFVYEGDTITGWQIKATANRNRSFEWNQAGVLGWGSVATELRESVAQGKPYVVHSLRDAGITHDSAELNDLLQSSQVESYVNIPMMAEGKPIATLFIMSRQPTEFSASEINTFSNLGDQMATLIYARTILEEARQAQQFALELVDTNRNITQAETSDELAASVLEALPAAFNGLTIALFNHPLQPGEDPERLETRFVASRAGIDLNVTNDFVNGEEAGLRNMLRQVRDNQFITMSASEPQAGVLPAASLDALRAYGARVVMVIGLQTGRRLLGVMGLGSTEDLSRKEHQANSLRAIGDQVAISLENRSLLNQTTDTLEETRLLYDINRAILAAQDTLDILRTIRSTLAHDASMISHSEIIYDAQGHIQDFVTKLVIAGETEQVVSVSLIDQIKSVDLERIRQYWTENQEPLVMIEDLDGTNRDYPLGTLSRSYGVRSFIDITVRESGLVRELITISYDQSRTFDDRQRRLYRSWSDQISIVLQNHRLLRDAQVNAAQLSEQVERLKSLSKVTAGIVAARTEKEMLAASTEAVVNLLHIDHCGILLVDESNPDFGIVVSEYPKQGAEGLRLSLHNNPLWDRFVSGGKDAPTIVNRNDPELRPDALEAMTLLGTHSMAFVPIAMNERIIGSVGLDMYDANRPFTSDILELSQIISAQINVSLQNMRLLTSVERGAEQLSEQISSLRQLQQLGDNLSTATDEKTLLDIGLQDLVELVKSDHCGVVLLNPDKMSGTVVSEYPATGSVGVQFGITGNPLYGFIQTGDHQPVVVNDVATDPVLDAVTRSFLEGIGTKALMILPLIVQNQVIGSIGIDIFSEGRPFSRRLIELAQTVSTQIALALQNIRLVQEAQRRAEQLQHIAVFSQSAQTILDVDAILRYMMIESSQILTQNQLSISLLDNSTTELRIVAQRIDGQTVYSLTNGETIPISGPIIQVWEKREAVYIPDLRAVAQSMEEGVTLRSWLLVPVMTRGRVTGLVSVGSDLPYAYTESDVSLFSQIVNQFSIVLENTLTYRQSQRVARNESLVNDISAQLQRQLDVESMLNITAVELGKALGARRARIRLGTQPGADNAELT